jgi:hypothetical protein
MQVSVWPPGSLVPEGGAWRDPVGPVQRPADDDERQYERAREGDQLDGRREFLRQDEVGIVAYEGQQAFVDQPAEGSRTPAQ